MDPRVQNSPPAPGNPAGDRRWYVAGCRTNERLDRSGRMQRPARAARAQAWDGAPGDRHAAWVPVTTWCAIFLHALR